MFNSSLVYALALRTGVFAEGRFLGKVLDEWVDDAQEFIHTKVPHLLVVALIGFLLSRLLHLITARMIWLAEQHSPSPGRIAQVRTLAGVIRTSGLSAISLLVGLQFLDAVGINLAPLLTSAGIAGVAIGLAAQNIVRDMFNGVLILVEDHFNVGDTVRVAGVTGVVEAMTLRKTTVRDADGTLYIIPNSQISTVANQSAQFTIATVQISVDLSAKPEQVIAILSREANAVCADPLFAPDVLAEPRVPGLDQSHASEQVFPVLFRTRAQRHLPLVRAFRQRVRLALEAEAILPGDPLRISSYDNPSEAASTRPRSRKASAEAHDPTATPPHESGLFG